ncbi:MAG TPA: M42 family peptidase, partial [Pyrodictium sp.]|nr:M42 family peptidase [Pyrodictium sp.]
MVSHEELDKLFGLLKKFADAFGISGYEDEIRNLVIDEVREYADEIWVDRLGNVVAVKHSGVEGAPRIVVDAHMDEIGFVVKHIDDKGFVYLAPIGGWSDIILPGQRIRIRTRDGRLVYGVIGSKPPHVMTPEEAKQVPTIDKLFVDIGVSSREEAEKLGVHVGAPADLDREAVRIGYKRATGKAFDDRVGVLVAVESFKKLAQRQIQADLYLVIASQEEVGLKGARTAAYAINPDIAIALDVTIAADVPG